MLSFDVAGICFSCRHLAFVHSGGLISVIGCDSYSFRESFLLGDVLTSDDWSVGCVFEIMCLCVSGSG